MQIMQEQLSAPVGEVKRLNYLLVHSRDARILAVKRVTGNKGGKTPGVDGEVCPDLSRHPNVRPPRYDALPALVGTGQGR